MADEGLGSKLKNLFGLGKSKDIVPDSKFKGQGHRLGTSEQQGKAPLRAANGNTSNAASTQRAAVTPAHLVGPSSLQTPPSPLRPPPQPQPGVPPVRNAGPLDDVILDRTLMANTPTGREASLLAEHHGNGPPLTLTASPASPTQPHHPTAALANGLSAVRTTPISPLGQAAGTHQESAAAAAAAAPGADAAGAHAAAHAAVTHAHNARHRLPFSDSIAVSTAAARRGSGASPGGGADSMVSTISTPTTHERKLGTGFLTRAPLADSAQADYGMAPVSDQAYKLQHALGLVLSYIPEEEQREPPDGESGNSSGLGVAAAAPRPAGPRESCEALLRIVRNVLAKPGEPKFRFIRLSNPKVEQTIVAVPGALEFLQAAGFEMRALPPAVVAAATALETIGPQQQPAAEEVAGGHVEESYLVLPDELPPSALSEPFRVLTAIMAANGFSTDPPPPAAAPPRAPAAPAPPSAKTSAGANSPSTSGVAATATAPAAAAAAVPAVARCMQVVLPVAPDMEQLPDSFFARTGPELKAQWQALMRRRDQDQQLMTRAMREQRAGPAAPGPNTAIVRVRFPEGVYLQGQFGGQEPVSRVFEWVSGALRSPSLTYELITPDRKPLQVMGQLPGRTSSSSRPMTVSAAGLLPSAILNLRPTGQEAAALGAARVPLLSDALLATTQAQAMAP